MSDGNWKIDLKVAFTEFQEKFFKFQIFSISTHFDQFSTDQFPNKISHQTNFQPTNSQKFSTFLFNFVTFLLNFSNLSWKLLTYFFLFQIFTVSPEKKTRTHEKIEHMNTCTKLQSTKEFCQFSILLNFQFFSIFNFTRFSIFWRLKLFFHSIRTTHKAGM